MMKILIIFLSCILVASCIPTDGCADDHSGDHYNVGETLEIKGICELKTCQVRGAFVITGCPEPLMKYPPTYIKMQDLRKSYPACCPYYVAPDRVAVYERNNK